MPTLRSHTHLQATKPTHRPKLAKEYACPTAQTQRLGTDEKRPKKKGERITRITRIL
jgi:hypothetical protein